MTLVGVKMQLGGEIFQAGKKNTTQVLTHSREEEKGGRKKKEGLRGIVEMLVWIYLSTVFEENMLYFFVLFCVAV